MRSEMLPLPEDPRWRRLLGVGLFLLLLYLFRQLAPVLVCFVILERSIGALAATLSARTGVGRKTSLVGVLLVVLGAATWAGVSGSRHIVRLARELHGEGREILQQLQSHPLFERLWRASSEGGLELGDTIRQHAMEALHVATGIAHLVIYLLVGLLLSVMYLFEREEIDGWLAARDPASIGGTLSRWVGYLIDAIVVTIRMQIVTALVNAFITLPVLLALKLPHVAMLFVMILVCGLIPVVGNLITGAVLCLVAFQERGLWAVGIFLAVTFLLHKIESYFLMPHLASKHVNMPGLILVVSLLLFEQLFGLRGLFMSFPTLYVSMRIRNEWAAEQRLQACASAIAPREG